jgi:uncharacterized protein
MHLFFKEGYGMKNTFNGLACALLLALILVLSGGCKKEIPVTVKSLTDKYIEYWNTGKFDGIEDVLCEDYTLLESPGYKPFVGIEAFKKQITNMFIAYPDFHLDIEEMIYQNDVLALRWSITATNTGPGRIPPTGKMIQGQGLSLIHFKDGKIKDEWLANNNLLWMTQLGYTFVPPGQ